MFLLVFIQTENPRILYLVSCSSVEALYNQIQSFLAMDKFGLNSITEESLQEALDTSKPVRINVIDSKSVLLLGTRDVIYAAIDHFRHNVGNSPYVFARRCLGRFV